MSEQTPSPHDDSTPEQTPKLEQLEQGTEPIVKYENEILKEIYQLIEDTALDMHNAAMSMEYWPRFVTLFLWHLERHAYDLYEWKNHLITIRDSITKRLDNGNWY